MRPVPTNSLGECLSKKYQPTRGILNGSKVIAFLRKIVNYLNFKAKRLGKRADMSMAILT